MAARTSDIPMQHDEIPREELGAGIQLTPERIIQALQMPKEGRVFDLDAGRAHNMFKHYATPPFEIMAYRTARGLGVGKDLDFLAPEVNGVNIGFNDEVIIATVHLGAHMDALCHITHGEENEWYGGFKADEFSGDFGSLKSDASKLPAIISRGVLLDVAGFKGVEVLPESYGISRDDLASTAETQGTSLQAGDVVLVRTGQMYAWPYGGRDGDLEAGLTLEAAKWLTNQEPVAIGSDSAALEVAPSQIEGNPQPVHLHVIAEKGVYILEWMYLDRLAVEQKYEFLFVALPLKFRGASGSWLRPVAIV